MVQELFATWPAAQIQGLIVWVPMLPDDDLSAAQRQATLWRDERVHQWWDGGKEMSGLWQRPLGLLEPAWDVYLLYPAGIRWDTEVPPSPAFWMHQLSDPVAAEDRLLCRDPSRLGRELATLLKEESMTLTSTLTCPVCAAKSTETMEVNACRYVYPCPSCGALLRPREGDCCVFCSHGDVPCPPRQTGNACCT